MPRRSRYDAKVAVLRDKWLANQQLQGSRNRNAFVFHSANDVSYIEKLRDSIERFSGGKSTSGVDGKLIVVKDNICTVSEPTTCASNILKGYQSPFGATAVQRLLDRDAFVTGKTNLDEFGMGSHSINSACGPTLSQLRLHGRTLSAGGSSGGSAVAVATNQCFAALGTDTGGSVRLPAAYTGVVGFKPSYGRVSRWGVVAYANSLDTVGVLARSAAVAKTVFGHMIQNDGKDPSLLSEQTFARMRSRVLDTPKMIDLSHIRVGVPKEYNTAELEPVVRQTWLKALRKLQSLGHTIHPVSLPTTEVALSAYYVIAAAEASSNLAKYDGVRYGNGNPHAHQSRVSYAGMRGSGFGEEVKKRILLGSYSLSAGAIDNYFIKAQKIRRLVQDDFNNVFRVEHPLLPPRSSSSDTEAGVHILITPTSQSLPPTLESVTARNSVDTFADDVLTVPASLAGLPAVTIPVPIENSSNRLPLEPTTVGIQVIGQYGYDTLVLTLAQRIQQAFEG